MTPEDSIHNHSTKTPTKKNTIINHHNYHHYEAFSNHLYRHHSISSWITKNILPNQIFPPGVDPARPPPPRPRWWWTWSPASSWREPSASPGRRRTRRPFQMGKMPWKLWWKMPWTFGWWEWVPPILYVVTSLVRWLANMGYQWMMSWWSVDCLNP